MIKSANSGGDGKAADGEQRYKTMAGSSRISLRFPWSYRRNIVSTTVRTGPEYINPPVRIRRVETTKKHSAADETSCRERTSEWDSSVRQHREHHGWVSHEACEWATAVKRTVSRKRTA